MASDYAAVSDIGEFVDVLKVDWESDSVCRILVVAIRTPDDVQSRVFGHVVHRTGIDLDRFAVDCLVEDILWCGYTKVMLKGDNKNLYLNFLWKRFASYVSMVLSK